ncbi:hypothetical protein Y5S_01063 [Alcanivorax nanhaiticus]|uniref:Uncharacterized protein n=1 Tax=Alcanivorax nanhaiticus TaxID=1177154 RepID=A0A095SNA8_9GAMM|nr:hypothetical protein [Alcanivorax nanhaiticus]KGD65839.1 hypothetical protein Y5S_01063 [Alcanivorax nanhaiticus]
MEKRRSTEPVFTRFTVFRVIGEETPFAILNAGGILAGKRDPVIVLTAGLIAALPYKVTRNGKNLGVIERSGAGTEALGGLPFQNAGFSTK